MAAFDLRTATPAMLQIPDNLNQGSRNMMQFMRQQQDDRNQKDRLAIDTKFREGQLALGQESNANQLESSRNKNSLEQQRLNNDIKSSNSAASISQQTLNNSIKSSNAAASLAKSKFDFDKGAQDRQVTANRNLNKELFGALSKSDAQQKSDFKFTDENIAFVENSEEFKSRSPLEQADYWANATSQFGDDASRNAGRKKTEQSLRKYYSETGGTPEQIERQVQTNLDSKFPPKSPVNAQLVNAFNDTLGFNSSTGLRKAKGLDDAGNIINEQEFVKDWYDRVGVESGTRSWFRPDLGNEDLNDNNLANYTSAMKSSGFNAVQALTALDNIRDEDTIDVKFKDFMSAEKRFNAGEIRKDNPAYVAYQKVTRSAEAAKDLSESGTQQQTGDTGARQQLFNMLNNQMQPNGQPTTVLQKRELLMGMLGEKLKSAQETGNSSGEIDEETAAIVETVAELSPNQEPGMIMKTLFGENANNQSSLLSSLIDPVANLASKNAESMTNDLRDANTQGGFVGSIENIGKQTSMLGVLNNAMKRVNEILPSNVPESNTEKMAALKYELDRIHPVNGDLGRKKEIKDLIATLSQG